MPRNILVIDSPRELPQAELDDFQRQWEGKGASFITWDSTKATSRDQAFEQLDDVDSSKGPIDGVISLASFLHKYKPIDAAFTKALPNARFLTGGGAGYDNIDTEALSAGKVYYCNTPAAVSIPTADSASVLILTTLKNTIYGDRNVRRGQWGTGVPKGLNPKGAVLGILGMGSIGRITARQLQAFGMKIVYHNRRKLPEQDEAGATYVESLSEFLGQCDVVSVHIPLSDATRHFLSTKEFAMFKKGSRVVNTARGPVIDEEALVAALKSGQLSGAGLDVFEQEPKVHPWLLEADNVILQPHTGSNTEGTLAEVMRELLQNVSSFLSVSEGQAPHNAVNEVKA